MTNIFLTFSLLTNIFFNCKMKIQLKREYCFGLQIIRKNIKETRKALKMTQEQLAEQIDVSTVFISQIENGSRKPSLETIYKISIALKIKIDTLINNDTADENIRDIEKLIELLSRCFPSERDFVTDISREVIIKLMEHKILD